MYYTKYIFFIVFFFLSLSLWSQSLNASFFIDRSSGCAPLTVHFTNTSTNSISFLWQFGDGSISTSPNPTHVFYSNSQSYHVILNATDSLGNTDSASAIINVKADLPYFIIKSNACPEEVLDFSVRGNSDNDNSVIWTFGNGYSSNSLTTQYAYADTGTYLVTMTVNNFNCGTVIDSSIIRISNTLIPTIHVHPSNQPQAICLGDNFPFYYDEIYHILWDFGDGSSSNDPYPTHHYSTMGTYNILLSVTNECGNTNSLNLLLDVTNSIAPLANFLIDKNTVCPNETFKLSGYSNNELSYKWLFDDNTTALGKIVIHSFAQPGLHTFRLAVSNNCSNTDTIPGSVNVVSSLNSVGYMNISPQITCPNSIINFKAPSGFLFYNWDFGDGSFSSNQNSQHSYSTTGMYNTKLRLVNFCSDTLLFIDSIYISNSLFPNASFRFSQQTFCQGSKVNFFPNESSENIKNYFWSFGDGFTDTIKSPIHAYSISGTYAVTLIVENYCNNKDTLVSSITIDTSSVPKADFGVSPAFNSCVNSSILFTNLSSDSIVTWDFGDGTISNVINPTHVYNMSGNYLVKQLVQNNCNKQSIASKFVRISARYEPIADIILMDSVFCLGESIQLQSRPSAVATNLLWDFGDGTQSFLVSPVKIYTNNGLYPVILTSSNDCGSRRDSLTIKIIDSLSSTLPTLSCKEENNNLIYSWTSVENAINYEITFDNGNTWNTTGLTNTYIYSNPAQNDTIKGTIRAIGACQKGSLSEETNCTLISNTFFNLYPNPFVQNLQLDLNENISGITIDLISVVGKNLYSIEIPKDQKNVLLNLNFLPSGIYLIKMTNKNSTGFSIKKIVKL